VTEPASRPATAWSSDGPNRVGRTLGVEDDAAAEDEEAAAAAMLSRRGEPEVAAGGGRSEGWKTERTSSNGPMRADERGLLLERLVQVRERGRLFYSS
jgi:hypothetical protein